MVIKTLNYDNKDRNGKFPPKHFKPVRKYFQIFRFIYIRPGKDKNDTINH